jgi:hypothetical protein
VRAEQERPTAAAAARGHRQSRRHRDDAEQGRRRAPNQNPDVGVKRFLKRAYRPIAIAILLIAFEFYFGLNWPARNNAIVKETGWQQGIHCDPLESKWPEDKEHLAPGQRPLLQYGPDGQIERAK